MRALLLSLSEFVRSLAALIGAITALLLLLLYGFPAESVKTCPQTCRAELCCPVSPVDPAKTEPLPRTLDLRVSGALTDDHKLPAAGCCGKRVRSKPVKPKLLCPEGAASIQSEVQR